MPLTILAAASFVAGAYYSTGSPEQEIAERFIRAWAKQDFRAMYAELTSAAKADVSVASLAGAYRSAQETATATAIDPGSVDGPVDSDGRELLRAQVAIETAVFGEVSGKVELPIEDGRIAWERHSTFPGLREGEVLGRRIKLPKRASILARDGTPLATGDAGARSSPLGAAALAVAGEVGRPSLEQRDEIQRQGLPPDAEVGISGLELAFNSRLAGEPGGELLAVPSDSGGGEVGASTAGRALASTEPSPAQNVKTTIDPDLQQAAVAALADRYGGIAILDARSGAVRALAGAAFSSPAPPGSTFKIVTTVAALEKGVVKLKQSFPVTDVVNVGGRQIENSHEQACGGTFTQSFAYSCNTVFAPLGPEIGEKKMVQTAEGFGFNQPPRLYSEQATEAIDPPESTIPQEIGDDLDLGVTAIGQGEVLATPLEVASMAQTIAAKGRRYPTPITTDPELGPEDSDPVAVTSPAVAKTVAALMEDVVQYGTGEQAAVQGLRIAGKTGTAELGPKPNQPPPKPTKPGEEPPDPEQILDAWFAAYAPADKPKLAIGILIANADGDGGQVAAPIAREIFASALG